MKKYKIALLTPLHPQKTGIADYIEEMLPFLRESFGELYSVDIFVDDCNPTNPETLKNHQIFNMDSFEEKHNGYDLLIYQMGNNFFHLKIFEYAMKYPGLLVLHDFAIHHLLAYFYLEKMKSEKGYYDAIEQNHGEKVRELAQERAAKGELGLWETNALEYPMNRTIVQRSKGVIVFSEYAQKRIEAYGDNIPVHRIYLHCSGIVRQISASEKKEARERLHLEVAHEPLICVFGFIGKPKRPYTILEAAGKLKDLGHKFKLVFVGELQKECEDLPDKIKEMGLEKEVTYTGFTTAEEFDMYLKASDVCLSLRYPTMGETSGVLMRALRYGKPSIVTNVGSFCEFPDEALIKIGYDVSEKDELVEALDCLLNSKSKRKSLEINAIKYASQHLEPQNNAKSFADFAKSLIAFEEIKKNAMYCHLRSKVIDAYQECGGADDFVLKRTAQTLVELFDRFEA